MVRKRCFVVMPFESDLDDVYAVIKNVATTLHVRCQRADEIYRSGSVLRTIVEEIEKADIVIADLTGRNPNVFYEVAVAHLTKAPQQVVLIAQSNADVPFDLQALRYLLYANNQRGREEFRRSITTFIEEALASSPGDAIEVIHGKHERTRRLVADLDALARADDAALAALTIRARAGLSVLAITTRGWDGEPGRERIYQQMLIQERNKIVQLIRRRVRFRCVLTPPVGRLLHRTNLLARFARLITLMEANCQDAGHYLRRCDVALFPIAGNNVYILGDHVLYEGSKVSLAGGFDITTRITHPGVIGPHQRAFDALFRDAELDTRRRYGKRLREPLREVVLRGLKQAYRDTS